MDSRANSSKGIRRDANPKNGFTNGSGKGFTNGSGKGFTNGVRNGFTNGSGKGFTNGLERNRQSPKRTWRRGGRKGMASVLLAVLFLSAIAAAMLQAPPEKQSVVIDGNFDDWAGIAKIKNTRNSGVPENIDIEEYAIAEQGNDIAFYMSVYGKMLYGDGKLHVKAESDNPVYVAVENETTIPNGNGKDVAYIFVDTDSNASTGFRASEKMPTGADRAVEITGKNGNVVGSRILLFAGAVQSEWKWKIGDYVLSATNGKALESMAGKDVLGIKGTYAVYFYMFDWQGRDCRPENALNSDGTPLTENPQTVEATRSAPPQSVPAAVPHAPIRINSNADFNADHGVTNGSGTQTNPYIIENYDIDAHGGGNAIYVGNTTAYFVIRNCTLYNASQQSWPYYYGAGLTLYNVRNGIITNNTASNNDEGIEFDYSSSNTISNNIASNNWEGIWLLYSSSNNTISNNNASNNRGEGIELDYSSNNNTISNNNASNNRYNGICLYSSSNNNTISNNNASNNTGLDDSCGIYLYSSSSNTISNNIASNNSYEGIYLNSSSNNTISNNNASNNDYGIYLDSSSNNNTISNNTASNNTGLDDSCGICLDSSSNNTISNNNASNNGAGGIYLNSYSSNNTITNNNASNNLEEGICLDSSSNNTITNNNASNNSYEGICLDSSSNNTISNNNASNNDCGIYLGSSGNNNISNNTASNNDFGIYLDSSSSNNITYNEIDYNTDYGVNITSSSTDNYILYNNFIGNKGASTKSTGGNTVKGTSDGISQAYDDVGTNHWYVGTEGNYWSNWDGKDRGTVDAYPIDGGADSSDYYPLDSPVPEFPGIIIPVLFTIGMAVIIGRRKK